MSELDDVRPIRRRILIGCYEVPGWGGAGTSAYAMFEQLQREGWAVSFVNLVSAGDAERFRQLFGDALGNPHGLEHVHTIILADPLWRRHAALRHLLVALAPDVLFGVGCIAAHLLNLAVPDLPVVLRTSGCDHLKRLLAQGAVADFMAFQRAVAGGAEFPLRPDDPERRAVEACARIIVHSLHVQFALEHFFPAEAVKIWPRLISVADAIYLEAERFQALRRPFAQRDIDVLFVANNWRRPEKNYGLVLQIVSGCGGLNVHVVGAIDEPQAPARYHGVVTRREDLYALLGRAKTVVCPSRFDAAPRILFEGSAMGCNVVASPNCGNWQLCDPRLVADRCDRKAFLEQIRTAVTAPYGDHREPFRGGHDELVRVLTAL